MSEIVSNQKIGLYGGWELAYGAAGRFEESRMVAGKEEVQWLECEVPGNVQLDLLKKGIIPDPFYGMNTEAIRKYEHYEWWYRKKFRIEQAFRGKRLELKFHGLDTFARIWLNGKILGETDNMFIPHGFDVTDAVDEQGENELVVKFSSPLYATLGRELSGCYASMGTFESLWARKARHSYGWDIAPRLLTAGIWREVELIAHEECEIKNIFARLARLEGRNASLVFHIDLDLPKGSWDNLKIAVHGECGNDTFDREQTVGSPRVEITADLEEARLWWPNGYGSPELYNIRVTLLKDGIPVNAMTDRIGIRTVELDQEKDDSGNRNFIIKINGAPIFCKGTNSVPMDAFHSRDRERIPEFINMVRETNCNMVRIWGGNVYEHPLFYDLCDEYGIMAMQDFMYTCAIYPQADEFLKTAENEARTVVKLLRNHPSLVVWCGDNEIDLAYTEWYNQKQSPENNKLTRRVLKDVCHYFDGTRPYMPSSPFSPTPGSYPASELEGDVHLYRHGTYYKSEEYLNNKARFYSEIGHLSLDNEESIKKFIPEDKIWPIDREVWDLHSGSHKVPYYHQDRLGCILKSVENMFGSLPGSLSDLVTASQIVQAEALKFWIERCRQRKFECSGILWWNMIDCWPQFSDAVVDYYYGKKLAYNYVKRAQEPVCIMFSEPESDYIKIIAGNDTPAFAEGIYKVWDADNGKTFSEGIMSVPPNSNLEIGKIDLAGIDKTLLLTEWTINGKRYCNHYITGSPPFSLGCFKRWLGTIKDFELTVY